MPSSRTRKQTAKAAGAAAALKKRTTKTSTPPKKPTRRPSTASARRKKATKSVRFQAVPEEEEAPEEVPEEPKLPEVQEPEEPKESSPLREIWPMHECSIDIRAFLDGSRIFSKCHWGDLYEHDVFHRITVRGLAKIVDTELQQYLTAKGVAGVIRKPKKVYFWHGGVNAPRLAEVGYDSLLDFESFRKMMIAKGRHGKTAEVEYYFGINTNPDEYTPQAPNRGVVKKEPNKKKSPMPKGVSMPTPQSVNFPTHLFGDRPPVAKGSSSDKMLTQLSEEIQNETPQQQMVRLIKKHWRCVDELCSNHRFTCWVRHRDEDEDHYKVSDDEVEGWSDWLLQPPQISNEVGISTLPLQLRYNFITLQQNKCTRQKVGGKKNAPKPLPPTLQHSSSTTTSPSLGLPQYQSQPQMPPGNQFGMGVPYFQHFPGDNRGNSIPQSYQPMHQPSYPNFAPFPMGNPPGFNYSAYGHYNPYNFGPYGMPQPQSSAPPAPNPQRYSTPNQPPQQNQPSTPHRRHRAGSSWELPILESSPVQVGDTYEETMEDFRTWLESNFQPVSLRKRVVEVVGALTEMCLTLEVIKTMTEKKAKALDVPLGIFWKIQEKVPAYKQYRRRLSKGSPSLRKEETIHGGLTYTSCYILYKVLAFGGSMLKYLSGLCNN
jgi:hypothetical protein